MAILRARSHTSTGLYFMISYSMREAFEWFSHDRWLLCGRHEWHNFLNNVMCGSRNFSWFTERFASESIRLSNVNTWEHTCVCAGTNVSTKGILTKAKLYKIECVPPSRNIAYFTKLLVLLLIVIPREILHVLLSLPNPEAGSENPVTFDLCSFN